MLSLVINKKSGYLNLNSCCSEHRELNNFKGWVGFRKCLWFLSLVLFHCPDHLVVVLELFWSSISSSLPTLHSKTAILRNKLAVLKLIFLLKFIFFGFVSLSCENSLHCFIHAYGHTEDWWDVSNWFITIMIIVEILFDVCWSWWA